jgi:uncharacterized membrane protein
MAGIGFELRKILKRDSLLSLMQAYSYAALISRGRGSCPSSASWSSAW